MIEESERGQIIVPLELQPIHLYQERVYNRNNAVFTAPALVGYNRPGAPPPGALPIIK